MAGNPNAFAAMIAAKKADAAPAAPAGPINPVAAKKANPFAKKAVAPTKGGPSYGDLPKIRKEEKGLEALIAKTKDPKKKAELRKKELRDEAIIRRLTTPKGKK